MSKRERDEKEGKGEKRMKKMNQEVQILKTLESLNRLKEKWKNMEVFLRSEFEENVPLKERIGGETYLHFARTSILVSPSFVKNIRSEISPNAKQNRPYCGYLKMIFRTKLSNHRSKNFNSVNQK